MNTSTFHLALVSLFAALIAVFGLIPKIDLPLGVPITLQTLGVMLAGCLLGPKRALQALLLWRLRQPSSRLFAFPLCRCAQVVAALRAAPFAHCEIGNGLTLAD
jgi:biotin transport system substrate-specific component